MIEQTLDPAMELVAGYRTYADVNELQIEATVEAPASTQWCITIIPPVLPTPWPVPPVPISVA